jgi:hypothetical protein
MIRGEIEAIREAVENIFVLFNGVGTLAPIYGAAAAQENEGGFFTFRGGGICFAGIQAAGGHAHPFPLDTFAGKVEKFTGLGFGERTGMDDVRSCGHEEPQAGPGFPGKADSGKATASAGKNQTALLSEAAMSEMPKDSGHELLANRLDCSPGWEEFANDSGVMMGVRRQERKERRNKDNAGAQRRRGCAEEGKKEHRLKPVLLGQSKEVGQSG